MVASHISTLSICSCILSTSTFRALDILIIVILNSLPDDSKICYAWAWFRGFLRLLRVCFLTLGMLCNLLFKAQCAVSGNSHWSKWAVSVRICVDLARIWVIFSVSFGCRFQRLSVPLVSLFLSPHLWWASLCPPPQREPVSCALVTVTHCCYTGALLACDKVLGGDAFSNRLIKPHLVGLCFRTVTSTRVSPAIEHLPPTPLPWLQLFLLCVLEAQALLTGFVSFPKWDRKAARGWSREELSYPSWNQEFALTKSFSTTEHQPVLWRRLWMVFHNAFPLTFSPAECLGVPSCILTMRAW